MARGESGPGEAEIRRALAQCMTLADIDDAMGWAAGTARRRRWRAPDNGGLPFADAELGGVPLWFRSTFHAWQDGRAHLDRRTRRSARPARSTAAPTTPPATPPGPHSATAAADPPPVPSDETGSATDTDHQQDRPSGTEAPGPEVHDAAPATSAPAHPHAERSTPEQVGPQGGPEPDSGEVPEPPNGAHLSVVGDEHGGPEAAVGSGFELEIGQRVLAEVHGRWRRAQVVHRDRGTVVVAYALDDTPLGARRQRITVDRVRSLPDGRSEG